MKKIVLLFIFCSGISLAQTRFGFKGGINADTRIANLHRDSTPRFAFHGGAFAEIPLGANNYEQFYLQPELLYSMQGEKGRTSDGITDEIYLNYLLVPLLFKAYFSEDYNEFYAVAGPQFGFLLNEDITLSPGSPATNEEFKFFDISIGLGLGYSFNRNFEIYARYSFGLTDIAEGGADGGQSQNRNSRASIGVAYIIN